MKSKIEYVPCKHCGNEIPSTSLFCMFCGNQIKKQKKVDQKKEITVPEPVRLSSGTWRIQLRKENVSITEETYEACKAKAIAVRAGYVSVEKEKAEARMKLGTIVQNYIDMNTAVLSPSTIRGYQSLMDNHFQSIMEKKVTEINWQTAINLESADNGYKTVNNAWRVITAAMRAAKLEVPNDVNLPKGTAKKSEFLDYEQIKIFMKGIEGKSCEKACLLALHSLRISEILALSQTSIEDDMIHVKGALVPNKDNKYVFKETNKNASSTRDIPVMIPRLLEIWPKEGEILTFQSQTTLREQIERVCKANGLPVITIHCLRHSFASLAYHLKWDKMTVCAVGGWNTSYCVDKIYTHLAKKDLDINVENMKSYYKA